MSDTPEDTSPYVGTAYMQPNGTLELRLRAETDDGLVGEAMVVYAPDDERYAGMLAHLGEIKPGQSVPIKPFS